MPRPRKASDRIRSRQVIFRLTDDEYAQLEAVATRTGLRVNELARRLTRHGQHRVVIRVTRQHDPAFIAQVRALGINLNQLAKNSNIFGRVSPKVDQVCEEIRRLVLETVEREMQA